MKVMVSVVAAVALINRFGNLICRQDVIRTIDRQSGLLTRVVSLGDFVPYHRR